MADKINDWRSYPELPVTTVRVRVFVLQKYDRGAIAHIAEYNPAGRTFHRAKVCKSCGLGPALRDVVRWRYA